MACQACLYPSRSASGKGQYVNAESWLVCPDGLAINPVCASHAEIIVAEFRDLLGQSWTTEPIYHEHGGNLTVDRK